MAAGILKSQFIDHLLHRLYKVTEIPDQTLFSTSARILIGKF